MAEERKNQALAAIEAALAGCPRVDFKTRLRKDLERRVLMSSGAGQAQQASGVRAGFRTVTPYIRVPDVEAVIEFARRVLGAEETHRATGSAGGVHCELRIGDSMVMIGGGAVRGRPLTPRLAALHVHIPDVDAAYGRALEAGGESMMGEPRDQPYGERAAYVKDAAGNHWYLATYLGEGPAYLERGLGTVTPHVYVRRTKDNGAPEFIEFMKAAFGARQEFRHDSPEGLILHGVVRIQDAAIELGEGHEAREMPAGFYLYLEDCDAVYKQALAAGAKSLFPPEEQPYGDRVGGVEDAWGNEWFLSTHLWRGSR
jgi:uncharacterized glyoxalase superfamily protein PhnB